MFTLILAGILCAFKMPVFDSFCHAFSTASTGGFSIKTANIAYYNNVGIDVTITIFMLLFSVNFNVFYLVLIQRMLKALKNEELISMLVIVFVTTIIVCATLLIYGTFNTFGEDLRYSSFMVVSMLSTTGFVNTPVGEDFTFWPAAAQTALAAIMIIGGSSGSTAGGIKICRLIVLMKTVGAELRRALHPQMLLTVYYDKKRLPVSTIISISRFFFLYIFTVVILALGVSATGLPVEESIFGVASCVSSVGPSFGMVGATGNFAGVTDIGKLIFALGMLLGRLELFTALALLRSEYWRKSERW